MEAIKKFKNQLRRLFLRISILTCQHKLNPFDETVTLNGLLDPDPIPYYQSKIQFEKKSSISFFRFNTYWTTYYSISMAR
jgi:hypothetical protein